MRKWKPGECVPENGTYACYNKNGICGGSIYLGKGKRFPVAQHPSSYYVKEEK